MEQFAYYKDSINENHLRCIVEQTIYGNMDILTDREYQLWVSIFADNCSKYHNIYEMYKIQKDIIDNTFTERNLMIQRVVSKLDIFVGNENHTARLFQSVIENLYRLFNFSWKNQILDWISQLPYNRFNQDKITDTIYSFMKKDFPAPAVPVTINTLLKCGLRKKLLSLLTRLY